MRELTFRVLGPVQILRNGKPVEVVGQKPLALLTGFLLAANETVSATGMIDWIWGEELPDHPRAALHSVASRLRRQLGPGLFGATPTGYRLTTDTEHLDRLQFEHLTVIASRLSIQGETKEAAAHLEKALGLWHEPLLGNVDSPVIHRDEAGRLTEQYLDALELYAKLCLDLGWHASAAKRLAGPVRTHPFREPLAGQLMVALLRSGRRADALGTYDRLRRALRDELGIDPNPELRMIYLKILRSGPERQQISLRATRSATARPQETAATRELPTIPRRLYGRDDELRRLRRWLTGGDHIHPGAELIAIVGPAGVGKTALAVRAAAQAVSQFPDGRLYVNLRGSDDEPLDARAALRLLLSSLRVDPEMIPADEYARAALYRSLAADRRMLVILDNVRDAGRVRLLLPGAEAICKTIVTSRNQLRGLVTRDGAQRIRLEGIPPDAGQSLLADLGALCPGTPRHTVAGLVEWCAGLPLGMRILAERLTRDGHQPDDLLHELCHQPRPLDLFDPGGGDAGLRGALAGSYRTLDADAARAYRRLSRHTSPSLSLNAATSLLGEPEMDTRRLLDQLVNVHLLDQLRPELYWFNDLIRAHARECAADQREAIPLTGQQLTGFS